MDEQTKNKIFAYVLQQPNIQPYQQNIVRDYVDKDLTNTFYIMMPRHSGRTSLKALYNKFFPK